MRKPIRIGIDASNIGGGGGITHLKEILNAYDATYFETEISKIIVFGSTKTLKQLPDLIVLEKKALTGFNAGVLKRIFFQIVAFDKYIRKSNLDILLSVTGDYIGRFKPLIGMSRNMLLYERKIWKEIKSPKEVLRFWINFRKQKRCFKNANSIIFISKYAKSFISSELNLIYKETSIIHHGISPMFIHEPKKQYPISAYSVDKPFTLLYVSTVHVYKHQSKVVKAVGILKSKGYPIVLNLIGGVIFQREGELLSKTINEVDKDKNFINYMGSVEYDDIKKYYQNTDGIIFASTCENMPNILLESMASGSPIACSDKEPMPEFLKENGFYFNSYNIESIVSAIEKMLLNDEIRTTMTENNFEEIKNYSWRKASKSTFSNIVNNHKLIRRNA